MRKLSAVLCVGLMHCAHARVAPPPSRTAPLAARAAYFREHRTRERVVQYVPSLPDSQGTTGLVLANGTMIRQPREFEPAVHQDSISGRCAREDAQRSRTANYIVAGGVTALVAGAATLLISVAVVRPFEATPAIVGGSMAGVGVLVVWGGEMSRNSNDAEDRHLCFERYDDGLQQQLGIAVERRETVTRSTGSAAPQ